jgi:hypothetical protein
MSDDAAMLGKGLAPAVADALAVSTPSYHELLRTAWSWNRSKEQPIRQNALQLLRELKVRYPHVLKIRYELAFAKTRLNDIQATLKELALIATEFPVLDEDTYCLWGRCYKDLGDAALNQGILSDAEHNYGEAIDKYVKASGLAREHSRGVADDRFSSINVATLRLVLASVMACQKDAENPEMDLRDEIGALRQESQEKARYLLGRRKQWKSVLPDDNIWIPATEAEAYLLLEEWDNSAKFYRAALCQHNIKDFHLDSMRAQVERILQAFGRLGVAPGGAFTNLDQLFAKPS